MNASTRKASRTTGLALGALLMAGAPMVWANWWAVTAQDAAICVGRVCAIEGKVASVVTTRDKRTVIMLEGVKPGFSAVIAADVVPQFHAVSAVAGHKVRITGLVKKHQGHLEAALDHPSQLALSE
jgi:hypothetical protein